MARGHYTPPPVDEGGNIFHTEQQKQQQTKINGQQ